eukprot:CAMPEP_0174379402 /NCGR_PEP_ID=MMETSP0811_2-20130205/122690_1 /TAXON_ID=73025 ORGANISM="Eutreptiella gymnastica-like, Strain CCMP1594" /NCGR_SAMPLE_ID=MMETSP0811_2 /ASSEMBLY_ACC=CAM_ASM_000667 /LENGTH=71 /DNA_ID=CAMNT_0015531933 /DNA_START=500 /DNA_END=715 /DNA_ORIENTATION=+
MALLSPDKWDVSRALSKHETSVLPDPGRAGARPATGIRQVRCDAEVLDPTESAAGSSWFRLTAGPGSSGYY